MTIEAIIFDMDGLLIDSEPSWDQARSMMAARVGKPWGHEDHLNVMGVSTNEWVQYMIKTLELTLSPEQVQTEIVQHMVELYQQQIPFKPFAVEAVKWAVQKFPVALASGSPPQLIDMVTNSPDLKGSFKVVISADEVGAGKPNPIIYLETARRLGIAAEKCLCIEDSPFGVLAGRRANMTVVNIPDPKFPLTEEQASHADLVLSSLSEVNDSMLPRLADK
jgi:beta-phosphoglucomutase-like phosphatase (HAD superfamily)